MRHITNVYWRSLHSRTTTLKYVLKEFNMLFRKTMLSGKPQSISIQMVAKSCVENVKVSLLHCISHQYFLWGKCMDMSKVSKPENYRYMCWFFSISLNWKRNAGTVPVKGNFKLCYFRIASMDLKKSKGVRKATIIFFCPTKCILFFFKCF